VQDLALTPGGVSKYRLAIATVADLTAPDDAGAQVGTVRYA
jgi:hypothetical protein